jgi:hypothetical protein
MPRPLARTFTELKHDAGELASLGFKSQHSTLCVRVAVPRTGGFADTPRHFFAALFLPAAFVPAPFDFGTGPGFGLTKFLRARSGITQ